MVFEPGEGETLSFREREESSRSGSEGRKEGTGESMGAAEWYT